MKTIVTIAVLLMLIAGTAQAQTYVGDTTCAICHTNNPTPGFFDAYMNSGHPWKVFRTGGLVPAANTWPHTPVPPLPMVFGSQLLWSDVEFVIGNFFWKARFIDRDGYIWTGDANDKTQWNLATQEFVPYHAGEVDKPFNCGRCHTTGYDPAGNQLGLPGLIGTWTEEGIRCEACHGPGSFHSTNPIANPVPGGKDCDECHYRDANFRMPWKGGFMRHHQQGEDLSHSPHSFYECSACHDPHRSVVYDDGGVTIDCADCHPGDVTNNNYIVAGMESVDCIDCHMPYMAKSAVATNASKADIRGHLFQIMTDPIAAADNTYPDGSNLFWNQDAEGQSFVTLDYACNGCHIDLGTPLTLEDAAMFANGIHSGPVPTVIRLFEADSDERGVRLSLEVSGADGPVTGIIHRGTTQDLQYAFSITPQPIPFAGMTLEYLDETVSAGSSFWYWIEIRESGRTLTYAGPIQVAVPSTGIAVTFMAPVAPNPTAGATVFQYGIGSDVTTGGDVPVSLSIYDSRGRLVQNLVNANQPVGEYKITWNGRGASGSLVSPGVYYYRLRAGAQHHQASFVMMK